jgi:hypothetical protein
MRSPRLLSALFAVVIPCSVAQAQLKPPPRFGLIAGINSSTVGGGDAQDAKRRTGAMAGISFVAPVSPGLSIEPELLYTMKGAGFSDNGTNGTVKMNYVEIPVLFRGSFPTSTNARPFLYGGPDIAFRVGCSLEAQGQGISGDVSCDEFESEGLTFKTVDYGIVIGAGVSFDLTGKIFTISARYDHSLGKLVEDSDTKHRVLSLVGTLEFPWRR